MSDLDLYHLLIQQMPLGILDGADYIRLDAVWRVPHDGSEPTLISSWQTWPLTTPARMIASERQLHEMQTALAQRDALIVRLTQELEAARRVPAGVALAATGMDDSAPTLGEQLTAAIGAATEALANAAPAVRAAVNRAAPPVLDAPPKASAKRREAGVPCPLCESRCADRRGLGVHMRAAHNTRLTDYERPPVDATLPPCPIDGCPYHGKRHALAAHVHRAHGQRLTVLERAAPVLAARIAEPPLPFDLSVELQANPGDKRRRAHRGPPPEADPSPPPTPVAHTPELARWACPVCDRDAFARSVAHPDRCLDCAAKLRQAA